MNKKWIVYGVTGAVGLAVLGGGAAAAADAMDLRTTGGTVVPGGAIKGGLLDRDGAVTLQVTDSTVTVVSAPSVAVVSAVSVNSPASPMSAPSAVSAPSPASAPSPFSAPSAASVGSAGSD